MPERTGAVVVHFRHWPGVTATLDALLAERPDRVVVVDDASGDGSAAAIRDAYPSVEVIEQRVNSGYAAAVNAGLARLGDCAAALVLTHECVVAPGALASLSSALDDADVVAAGPVLGRLDDRDAVWSAGGRLSAPPDHLGQGTRMSEWDGRAPYGADWLDGAAMLLRLDAVAAVGGLDESYFLYVEEVDLLWRLRRAGGRVVVVPGARAWQQPSYTPPYLQARNLTRFARVAGRPDIARAVWRIVAQRLRHKGYRWEAVAMLRGINDARTGRLDRRWALRRERGVRR